MNAPEGWAFAEFVEPRQQSGGSLIEGLPSDDPNGRFNR